VSSTAAAVPFVVERAIGVVAGQDLEPDLEAHLIPRLGLARHEAELR
jgi:hypothetical protein